MKREKTCLGQNEIPIREGFFVFPNRADGSPRLIGSKCRRCGDVVFPKRKLCTVCDSGELMEEVFFGENGVLQTYTIVRVAFPNFEAPYILGLVELPEAENLRVLAQIEDCALDEVRIGMPLALTIGKIKTDPATGKTVIGHKYRPVSESGPAAHDGQESAF
jgi:uncharacterized OB-fold protein